ncbi:MAG TPA: FAD-dependent oxidoreductase [Candidatus Dormibacteraeota bacterium]|nr:FAD-dependent oxidoreductase [Candidatus Dormibacteraeota bacterium]
MQLFNKDRMWRHHELRPSYDVVIVGAGVHGLAAAYYLGKEHGIRKVALLDKSYLGAGASGRNTAILRSNYRTPEGIPFYNASLRLYEQMSRELQWNVLFSQCGHLTLAHNDSSVTGLRVRAENNQLLGVNSRMIDPEEIGKLVPSLNLSREARYPILAGLHHPPGGIIRHDAVVWGYARACDRMDIEIHPYTEVTGISVQNHKAVHVTTNRGQIAAGAVLNATAGWASTISRMAGVPLPIVTHPLQACVTEPLKPFLNVVIVSASLHVYLSQTDKGELVIGAEIDPYQSYSMKGTLPTLEQMATYTLELFPQLHGVRILRQWAGICDMTPDFAPIMGTSQEVTNFYMDIGWGTYGFKAAPISGKCMAELIATGQTPDLIGPFSPARFAKGQLVGEKAAAAVSH